LYIVASRYEGGPQAILECAATKTPIISTDVGVSQEILDPASIYNLETILDAKPNQEVAYKNVKKHFMPVGFNEFLDYFRTIK
jgi:glycosyltransferase involved in cell wall biosynthesis